MTGRPYRLPSRPDPGIEDIYLTGETKTSCRLISGVDADLRVVSVAEYPSALMYFTGSKEHNVRLRGIAKRKGLKLNEYGLFDGDRPLAVGSEEDVYRELGLAYIPPELREDMGEIEAAGSGGLPGLVGESDIRGVFHVHTTFSDGSESLERMVDAARKLGFACIGISDHSKSAYYAGGLKRDDLERQWELIRRPQRKARWLPHLQGHRERHPARRQPRLRRGYPQALRLRHRLHSFKFQAQRG
jgi:DNA polymerase (family 10)